MGSKSGLLAKAAELVAESEADRTPNLPPGFDIDEVIGYEPRPLQRWIEQKEQRFNVEVLHRRFGKTVMKIRKLIRRAAHCPFERGRYAYVAPTYSQAEDIAWAYLYEWARLIYQRMGLPERDYVERGKLAVHIPTFDGNLSRIRLYGVDSPKQRLRGLYLDGLVMDEYAWVPPSVWGEQLRAMLMDNERAGVDLEGEPSQWADFIFTPIGRNHAHTLYRRADQWCRGEPVRELDPETGKTTETFSKEWFACRIGASKSKLISRNELAQAYQTMGRSKYNQEMEVSFDAASEGAVFAKEIEWLRSQGRIHAVPYNPLLPVHTGWDLGWDSATAIWFVQIQGQEPRVIDFYEATGAGLSHYADVLAERGYRYGKHFLPWDIEIHEVGSGKSRSSILRELGIRPTTLDKKYSPVDREAIVQSILPMCRFDETACAEGLDRLALYQREWNERMQKFQVNARDDWASHAADAFGYMCIGIRSMIRYAQVEHGSQAVL